MVHTRGSRSFGQHKKAMEAQENRLVSYREAYNKLHKKNDGEFVSTREKKFIETYEESMTQKYGEDTSSHPVIDSDLWLKDAGENKKKRVHGMGHSLDLGTSSSTQASSPEVAGASTNLTPMTEEQVTAVINNVLASFLQTQLPEMMRQIIQAVQPSTTPSTNQHREDQGRDDDFTSLG